MRHAWEEAFAPGEVPDWLVAFEEDPGSAVDALLWGRFYFGSLQMAEPADLLIDWLDLLGGEFTSRLDQVLHEWVEGHWGQPADVATEIHADAWTRLLAVVAWSEELEQSGAILGARFDEAQAYLAPMSVSPSRDPLGRYLAAVASNQKDRTLAAVWWMMCDLKDGVPFYHARYAIAGLRGLPPEEGDSGGGFRRDVVQGVVRLAKSFYRLSQEAVLNRRMAREEFLAVGRMTYTAFPFVGLWTEALAQELPQVEVPIVPWLIQMIPGGGVELQRMVKEQKADHLRPSASPDNPETSLPLQNTSSQTDGNLSLAYSPKSAEIDRQWHVVDATDQALGRLATRVASILRGKHKAIYSPDLDTGDFVIVVNAEKVVLTGHNEDQKVYYRHSGRPDSLKEETARRLSARRPSKLVEYAVKGMLPHNRLGRQLYRKLKVYAGPDHPYEAKRPTVFEIEPSGVLGSFKRNKGSA